MMFLDFLGFLLELISGVVAIVLVIFSIACLYAWTIGPKSCKAYGSAMKVHSEYKFWNGCFVEMPDGRTLPMDIAEDVLRQEYKIKIK